MAINLGDPSQLNPPPKFIGPQAPGPQTTEEWAWFIRWLFNLFTIAKQTVTTPQAISFAPINVPGLSPDAALGSALAFLPAQPPQGPRSPASPPIAAQAVPAPRLQDLASLILAAAAKLNHPHWPDELTGLVSATLGRSPYYSVIGPGTPVANVLFNGSANANADLVLTNAFQDVPNATLVIGGAGTYLVMASAYMTVDPTDGEGEVQASGASGAFTGIIAATLATAHFNVMGSRQWLYTTLTAGDTVKLQAKATVGTSGNSKVFGTYSGLLVVQIA